MALHPSCCRHSDTNPLIITTGRPLHHAGWRMLLRWLAFMRERLHASMGASGDGGGPAIGE